MHLPRILLLTGCLALSQAAWAEEEQQLTLDQLPAAVKAAALKQANGAKITEIEAETKKGKTVYEITFGETEVTFDANGTVLRSKVEKADDEDEDDAKDGKDGKSHKGKDGKDADDDEDDEDEDEDEAKDGKAAKGKNGDDGDARKISGKGDK